MKIITSRSAAETESLGLLIAKKLWGKKIVVLMGPLGSGKTTFVKGLARGLGIKKPVTSPTFSLVKTYRYQHKGRRLTLYHVDLYRLKTEGAIDVLKGCLEDAARGGLVVEWPERAAGFKELKPDVKIYFSYGKEGQRKIKYD